MNTKKIVSLLLVALMVAVAFAGCGAPAAPASGSAAPAAPAAAGSEAAAPAEGEAAHLRAIISQLSTKMYTKEVGDLYASRNPGVTFEIIDVPQDEYSDKIAVMLSGGDDIDVIFVGNNEEYLRHIKNGAVIDMTDLYTRDGITYEQFGGVADRFVVGERIYGLPYRTALWLMFYNKDLFDAAGVPYPPADGNYTWDDYNAMLPKLTSGDGPEKVYGGFFMQWTACVQNLAIQNGEHITAERDYSFMKYAYDLVTGMQRDGTIVPYSLIQANNLRYESAFFQQQVATVYQGSWFLNPILTAVKDGTMDFEWGVAPAPYTPDGKHGQAVGTAFVGSINANAANPEHAWEYLKLMISEEGAAIMAKTGDISANATERTYTDLAALEGMSPDITTALAYDELYFEVAMHDLAGAMGTILNEEHSLIMTDSITVDEGLAETTSRAAELWEEYDAENSAA